MVSEATLPLPYRVVDRERQTHDCVTLHLSPLEQGVAPVRAGQFTMLYATGVGEIAVSVSGDQGRRDGTLSQTIRDVGAVSHALHDARRGTVIGVRGPFGVGWDVESATGHDVVVVAGGVGLAPLRPVVLAVLADRGAFGDVTVVVGSRTPADLLFRDELEIWGKQELNVVQTIDQPATGWTGRVGFVTEPLARLELDPERTMAFLCGPEPMMRFCADGLMRKGVPAARIRVSLERDMKCGIALCGHCQLGPVLVCRDGPVVDYAAAAPLLHVREL